MPPVKPTAGCVMLGVALMAAAVKGQSVDSNDIRQRREEFEARRQAMFAMLAGAVLDLYWATWAEEQIGGVRGGAASRVYPGPMSLTRAGDAVGRIAGFYLGTEPLKPPRDNEFTALTSTYRMPEVVMDLALDVDGRGVYEIRQRRMGLVLPGYFKPPDYRMAPVGGILRYTFCCPEFIMGTALLPARPFEDWAMISSQNRWHGVIFAGHPDARIVPQCDSGRGNTFNQQWSVQSKGTLIVQRLPGSQGAGNLRIWFSRDGLVNRVEREEWVFVEAPGAYAAMRPVRGEYDWREDARGCQGQWLHCIDRETPAILEIARKADIPDYAAFQNQVLARMPVVDGGVLSWTGLGGDTLTLPMNWSGVPTVNGKPVDYTPARVFDSPFIASEWNSGVVTIRKDNRTLVLRAEP